MSPRPDPVAPESGTMPVGVEELMAMALEQARLAEAAGETPVGAVLMGPDGEILARAHNQPITRHDATAHAEILCLREAGERVGNYRLPDTVLAVTLEPCLMCVGALIHARIAGVVVGATDPKSGALFSHLDGARLPFGNHKMWVRSGVLGQECSTLLKSFFRNRRR